LLSFSFGPGFVSFSDTASNFDSSFRGDQSYTDILKVLVDHGADVRYLDGNKQSALFYAAARGRFEVARILMAKGSDSCLLSNNE
jgi:ankyrin repeat protein